MSSELLQNFKGRLEGWLTVMEKIKDLIEKGRIPYDEKGVANPEEPATATAEQRRAMTPEVIPVKEKKETTGVNIFLEVKMRMDMNKEDFVNSFEDIGMANPFDKKSIQTTIDHCSVFDLSKEVYPHSGLMDYVAAAFSNDTTIKQPKVIFLPGKRLLRKMIRAMITLDTTN